MSPRTTYCHRASFTLCVAPRSPSEVSAAAYLVLAVAILYDKNDIFPKWFAYVSIWQIVTEVIATQMFVFESGPFAWNGSIAFWLAVVVFSVWLSALIVLLRKAAQEHLNVTVGVINTVIRLTSSWCAPSRPPGPGNTGRRSG